MAEDKALAVSDPFQIMDRLDDKQIVAELEGRLPEILTYHFKDKGQEVWGLSKRGVDEAKSELARKGEVIREMDFNWTNEKDEAYFVVKAGRYLINNEGQEVLLDTAYGTKRQPKNWKKDKPNPFWFEQGGMKASRNACSRLIPNKIKEAVIAYAKKEGKVQDVKPEKEDLVQSDEDFATEKQIKKINTLIGKSDLDRIKVKLLVQLPSLKDLTKDRASKIIDQWDKFVEKYNKKYAKE